MSHIVADEVCDFSEDNIVLRAPICDVESVLL